MLKSIPLPLLTNISHIPELQTEHPRANGVHIPLTGSVLHMYKSFLATASRYRTAGEKKICFLTPDRYVASASCRGESEQGFSTKGKKLEVEISCSSLKQDSGLTVTVHFFTEPEHRSSVKMVRVTQLGPTMGPPETGKGKGKDQVPVKGYSTSREKLRMMLDADLPMVWSRP